MGTDIHMYTERRIDGKWVTADIWTGHGSSDHVKYDDSIYHERSYDTFAILADVRNGTGFAGVDTGDGFVPIATPRGLPSDMSPEPAAYSAEGCDHTPSWLTLAELLAYDWAQATIKRGVVHGAEFLKWNRWARGYGEGPDTWAGAMSGPGYEHVTLEEADRRLEKFTQNCAEMEAAFKDLVISISWKVTYAQSASYFLTNALPKLLRLGPPEDVRIVFWFDS